MAWGQQQQWEWSDTRHIRKVEPTGFLDGAVWRGVRERS